MPGCRPRSPRSASRPRCSTVVGRPSPHRGGNARWLVLSTVLVVQFAQETVNTVLSAALKDVARDLSSTEATLAWAITGPFLALGIGNPIFGRLGDARGRRALYLAGVALFAASTFASHFAHDATAMIVTRAAAGLGTAIA